MKWSDSGGGDFEQAPVGTEAARCVRIIDLGTQKGDYQGQVTRKRQNLITWELPNSKMETGEFAGQPFLISKFYTASLGEKANLRRDLVNWRGREFSPEELAGFDPKNILGKCCMLSITANDKGKSRVTAVMALPKGMPVPDQINPSIYFSLDEFSPKIFDGLSKGIKEIIEKSPEYALALNPERSAVPDVDDSFNDDIPF
jgi:hypothetical protein